MLKSMTAFGRSSTASSLGRFLVEIQSVNRKHLEINTFIPKELSRFDSDIKKWISEKVLRGFILVRISVVFEQESPISVTPNIPLARQLQQAWHEVAQELGFTLSQELCLRALQNEPSMLIYDANINNEGAYRHCLKQAIDEALSYLIEMKKTEGLALQKDTQKRLANIEQSVKKIAIKAPETSEKLRKKLQDKLEELLPGKIENEDKVLREVAVYAEKVDITEEVTRLKSHLQQFSELLDSDKEGIGKTMEFLIQEMNREANTIGSKAGEIEITKSVIDIKSELERIREQIQNVE